MKDLELSGFEARQRLTLFLKLRKNKSITDKTIKDFKELINAMYHNFKDHNESTISRWEEDDYRAKEKALQAIRDQMISFESGGNHRLQNIESFGMYVDNNYKASIKGELKVITAYDYTVLSYIFFGRRKN